ncbi:MULTISPECIES: hypothetical protein [Leptospira]|uniref:hypothetical protein n=1 Tax=Leptospira TaxID=171 RepID=UPI0003481D49|nr:MULTISPECIES: hypothetical protein [Leptospira]
MNELKHNASYHNLTHKLKEDFRIKIELNTTLSTDRVQELKQNAFLRVALQVAL